MSILMRCTVLAAVAGLIGLVGCGTVPATSPGAAQSPTPTATSLSNTGTPSPAPRACAQPGSYLTAIRVGEHAGYDRVVFQFSGGLPVYDVDRVGTVYSDPKGTPVPLAGQSFLWVVFRGASAVCGPTATKTYPGPSTLTPFYPELLVVSAAGDFEGYLSFGIGLAARGGYHVFTLTDPDRVVIDVGHVALGKFPGIWPVTGWPRYWALQYSWNTGHQPWLATPVMVVQAWARHRWHVALPVRQVNANTFKVGRLDTVTGTRPVTHGPWVITTVTAGLPRWPAESACWAPGPAKTPGTVPGYVPGPPRANRRESKPITAKDGAPRPRRSDVGNFLTAVRP